MVVLPAGSSSYRARTRARAARRRHVRVSRPTRPRPASPPGTRAASRCRRRRAACYHQASRGLRTGHALGGPAGHCPRARLSELARAGSRSTTPPTLVGVCGPAIAGRRCAGPLDAPEDRWSFGGGTAMETSAGLLFPEALVVGAGHAVLDASLMPSGNGEPATARPRRPLVPETQLARWVPRRARATRRARRRRADAAVATMRSLARPDEVTVIDDRGARYALHPGGMSGKLGPSGEPAGPMSVRLRLDPVPRREVRWLELTGPCINRPQPASDLSQPPRSLQKVQSLPNPQQLAVAGGLGNGPGVRCHSSVMSKSASSRNLNWNSQPRCRIHRARPRTQPGQAGIHGPLPARHARRATRHGSGHQRLTDDLRIQTHKSLSSK